MDKTQLYYIIRSGTNQRTLNTDKSPFVVDAETIESILREYPYINSEHEKITIEEYEQKFVKESE